MTTINPLRQLNTTRLAAEGALSFASAHDNLLGAIHRKAVTLAA